MAARVGSVDLGREDPLLRDRVEDGEIRWCDKWGVSLFEGALVGCAVIAVVTLMMATLGNASALGTLFVLGNKIVVCPFIASCFGSLAVAGTLYKVHQHFEHQKMCERSEREELLLPAERAGIEVAHRPVDLAIEGDVERLKEVKDLEQEAKRRKEQELARLQREHRILERKVERRLSLLKALKTVPEDDLLKESAAAVEDRALNIKRLQEDIGEYEQLVNPPSILRMKTKIARAQERAWGDICDRVIQPLSGDFSEEQRAALRTTLMKVTAGESAASQKAIVDRIHNFYTLHKKKAPRKQTLERDVGRIVESWEDFFAHERDEMKQAILDAHQIGGEDLANGVAALRRRIGQLKREQKSILERAEAEIKQPLVDLSARLAAI